MPKRITATFALLAMAIGLLPSIALAGRAAAAPPSTYDCPEQATTASINSSGVYVHFKACIRQSNAAGKYDGWVHFAATQGVTIWFEDQVMYNAVIAGSYGGKWRNLRSALQYPSDPASDASYPGHSCARNQSVRYGVRIRQSTNPTVWSPTSWSPSVRCP
ncbi:hypothetical protein ACQP2E_15800 [Actinoplanes sp. CA-015351]|uniref:hypothetical protein n=1 Tax=Actinoplanes sp. CA-015351 TaxID=3239897 RepID=UPI003D99B52D